MKRTKENCHAYRNCKSIIYTIKHQATLEIFFSIVLHTRKGKIFVKQLLFFEASPFELFKPFSTHGETSAVQQQKKNISFLKNNWKRHLLLEVTRKMSIIQARCRLAFPIFNLLQTYINEGNSAEQEYVHFKHVIHTVLT